MGTTGTSAVFATASPHLEQHPARRESAAARGSQAPLEKGEGGHPALGEGRRSL